LHSLPPQRVVQPSFLKGFSKELPVARIRLPIRWLSVALLASLSSRGWAVQPSESLLPATTKGFISTHDVDEVRKKFNETQLGEMVADPLMKPFIDDLRKQIGQMMEKAGKKLGVKWGDLEGVYGGEVAAALIQPDPKDRMSHATVLIVDITGKREQANALLAKIDANQKANKAVRSATKAGGVDLTVYTQPQKAGETAPERAYYFIRDDQLVVSDHQAVITAIAGRFGGSAKDSLATVKAFEYSMQRNAKEAGEARHHVRWFIEPFGYLDASRAAQGARRKRGTDILKILQTQGFAAIQGVGGNVFFATAGTELLHRTYVYAPPAQPPQGNDKYHLAMRMLDFPNSAAPGDLEPQAWAMADIASYLTFNWKMKEAFEFSETLVDAIAGDKGVFKDIWLNMKVDPNGPKIDIFQGLVNHLGTRATLLSDVRLPVDIKSERLMALIEVMNESIVEQTVEQAFRNDPQARKRVFRDRTIWEITQEEGLVEEEPELMIEGAGFVVAEGEGGDAVAAESAEVAQDAKKKPAGGAAPPAGPQKMPNMAITVHEGHLVVATHVDFVEDLIAQNGNPMNLGSMEDYGRVRQALTKLGSQNDSFRFFARTDESYRATYELLKQGRLPEAETMFAHILNAMMVPGEEGGVRKQAIDASKLPDFDQVKKYLGPGGVYAQSEEDGWLVVGCLLKKQ
jgi:hypothetical protein